MDLSSDQNPANESVTPHGDTCLSPTEAERIAARVRFLFRLTGDNRPARELEKQLMAYRLGTKSK